MNIIRVSLKKLRLVIDFDLLLPNSTSNMDVAIYYLEDEEPVRIGLMQIRNDMIIYENFEDGYYRQFYIAGIEYVNEVINTPKILHEAIATSVETS